MDKGRKDAIFRVTGVLGLAALLGIVLWAQKSTKDVGGHAAHDHSDPAQHGHDAAAKQITQTDMQNLHPSGRIEQGIRVVDYDAFQYAFDPDPLVVRAGERVNLRVKSRDVTHGVMIPGIDFSTDMPASNRKSVEFTAPDKQGEYPVFCSVFCGPGHGDMTGRLIILPAADENHHDEHNH